MINTPSCVPAVPGFEDTGSFVGPEDIAETMDWPSVVGLGEMMNFPGILGGTDHAHGEVGETLRAGKIVTGHYSMPETDRGLNAYVASGVRCCHESTRAEDAMAKMRFGMYAMMRYGSAWKDLPVIDGKLESDIGQDVLKTFVFERHHETGKFGYGFVKGFGIKRGAMASTVAHDAHNLLVVGTNDDDMALAANTLIACGGGMVVVADGEILGLVELPIAGLMDAVPAEELSEKVHGMEKAWAEIGCTMPSPFMTRVLIPLACLPELRLTNRGLVDCTTFQFATLLAAQ